MNLSSAAKCLILFTAVTCAGTSVYAASQANAGVKKTVEINMASDGPPVLEKAIMPYAKCLDTWAFKAVGAFETLAPKMDFRNGPVDCTAERAQVVADGMLALAETVPDETERKKLVRDELLSLDTITLSALVWASKDLVVNQ
ncbi:hypothetical protein [Novosphingobium gossypii]|uniref:hypothetical protein n=1 Tax=Novosphingobium gossypii TaxID=1604774 RepID=UPI003D21F50D